MIRSPEQQVPIHWEKLATSPQKDANGTMDGNEYTQKYTDTKLQKPATRTHMTIAGTVWKGTYTNDPVGRLLTYWHDVGANGKLNVSIYNAKGQRVTYSASCYRSL